MENLKDFENNGLSEDVRTQLDNLGLYIKDFNGDVLDIGAGDGQLEKELKSKCRAAFISIDESPQSDEVITGDAKDLEFADESFDLVISHASVPNVFLGMYSSEHDEDSEHEIEIAIHQTLDEIYRVLKPGSKAVLSPISIADNYPSQRAYFNALDRVLDDLNEEGVVTDLEFIKSVINPNNGEVSEMYRLKIYKAK